MKHFVLILLVICCCSCSQKQLLLLKSTSQSWLTKENNLYGTNYHFLLKTFANKNDLKLDSLCINNNLIKNFHYSVIGKSNTYINYISKDTILISINAIENKSGTLNNCLCKKKNSSCIYFSFKNKNHILNINSITILPDLK